MNKTYGGTLALLAVAMLLLLTAWGNALAMAVVSGIGSVVALVALAWCAPGWRAFGWKFLGMVVAFSVAAVVAWGITSSLSP
jgi:hypothetical protein